MSDRPAQFSVTWCDVDVVVAAYAGTGAGLPAFGEVTSALRRSLDARLWLLCPCGARAAARGVEGTIEYPAPRPSGAEDDRARVGTLAAIDALGACRAQAALVFAERGFAPYVPAYLCYLAGIPYRAGGEAEFGGAVLSPAVRLPPGRNDVERHLALLEAVGLAPDERRRARSPGSPSTTRSVQCGH